MRKIRILIALVIMLSLPLLISNCKKEDPDPYACFTLSQTTVGINELITTINCSVDASDYVWTDTDGAYSTDTNPSFVYFNPGTYGITLTAYTKSKSNESTQYVTVVHKTGNVTFWQSGTPAYKTTTVVLNGITKYISVNSTNGVPDCSQNGCANFTLPTGTYTFEASDGDYVWTGTVTILADECLKFQLL